MHREKDFGFHHRYNPDGTIDSICLSCYRTIGTTESEDCLGSSERIHRCPEDELPSSSPHARLHVVHKSDRS
jgi:hypothetical protein